MHKVTQPAAAHKFEHLMVSVDDAVNFANMAQDILVMHVIGALAISCSYYLLHLDTLVSITRTTEVHTIQRLSPLLLSNQTDSSDASFQ